MKFGTHHTSITATDQSHPLVTATFLFPIEEKSLFYGNKLLISEKKHNFQTKLSDCSVMMRESNYKKNPNKIGFF